MKKLTFGTPEELTPSKFCPKFSYQEASVSMSKEHFSFRSIPTGFVLEWEMEPDTQVFGFGLQLKRFNHTGYNVTTRVNADPTSPNGESHAPVPFLVTNKGYGIYFDTARYAQFHCGIKKPGKDSDKANPFMPVSTTEELYAARNGQDAMLMSAFIPSAKGVDIYIIEGNTITEIVSRYNMLSGGGPDVPEWGLGVMYRCCTHHNDMKVREVASYFREKDIPCYLCRQIWLPGRVHKCYMLSCK